MEKDFYTIGQTSTICGLSIQTLRYYDKIGLLTPSYVDAASGYRYYSRKDMIGIRILQDLKELGCSLEEIRVLLNNNDLGRIAELFKKKTEEYTAKIGEYGRKREKMSERVKQIDILNASIEENKRFEDGIELKLLPERKIYFTRYYSGCDQESLVMRFYELDTLIAKQAMKGGGDRLAIYHDYLMDFDPQNCDLEVGIATENDGHGAPYTRVINAGLHATASFHGSYQGQCEMLVQWLRGNGYQITGPGIEVYVNGFMNTPFASNYITEIQFPVAK